MCLCLRSRTRITASRWSAGIWSQAIILSTTRPAMLGRSRSSRSSSTAPEEKKKKKTAINIRSHKHRQLRSTFNNKVNIQYDKEDTNIRKDQHNARKMRKQTTRNNREAKHQYSAALYKKQRSRAIQKENQGTRQQVCFVENVQRSVIFASKRKEENNRKECTEE